MRVALRDAAGAKTLAERIAAEPGFARPVSGDATELNSALPPAFFSAQDALRQHARTLAETAARGEVEPLTAALVPLVQTCQGCHALYLKGPPGPESATPPPPPPPQPVPPPPT